MVVLEHCKGLPCILLIVVPFCIFSLAYSVDNILHNYSADASYPVINVRLWPTRLIPYRILSLTNNPLAELYVRRVIAAAVDEFTNRTCIRFTQSAESKISSELLHIVISNGSECDADIGLQANSTTIVLGQTCAYLRLVLLLLMRVLGLPNEENRLDRDNYVKVIWQNIIPERKAHYARSLINYNNNGTDLYYSLLKLPYDYLSVLHIKRFTFNKGRFPTLLPLYESGWKIGQTDRLSYGDLTKLNLLYQCVISDDGNEGTSTGFGQPIKEIDPMKITLIIRLWPNGKIPYLVESMEDNPHYNQENARNVNEAFKIFNQKSCVQLVPVDESRMPRDYLVLIFSNDCDSPLGRWGGPQRFTISPYCHSVDEVLQKLLRTVGVIPDLRRNDREKHFNAEWNDLLDFPYPAFGAKAEWHYLNAENQFIDYDPLSEAIDYNYTANFFYMSERVNGTVTLVQKKPDELEYPHTVSHGDEFKIQHIYNCTMKQANFIAPFPLDANPSNGLFTLPVIAAVFTFGLIISACIWLAIQRLISRRRQRSLDKRLNKAISDYNSKNCENLPLIDAKIIKLEAVIGTGNFGVVHKAVIESSIDPVAVKMIKTECFIEAVREAKIHFNLVHANIVAIHGMAFLNRYTMLILEMMDLGSLKEFLEKSMPPPKPQYISAVGNRILDVQQLLDLSHQIACGLTFLASNNVVHRDLSARNCLVSSSRRPCSSNFSAYIVKISDFGLSRRLYGSSYYLISGTHESPVIIAPECLQNLKFTLQSDIWSFGMTLWEVFSFGCKPFDSLPHEIVRQQIALDETYRFMKQCSALRPDVRPTATAVEHYLHRRSIGRPDDAESEGDNRQYNDVDNDDDVDVGEEQTYYFE